MNTKDQHYQCATWHCHKAEFIPRRVTRPVDIGRPANETDLFSLAKQLPDDYYIIAAGGKYTLVPGKLTG